MKLLSKAIALAGIIVMLCPPLLAANHAVIISTSAAATSSAGLEENAVPVLTLDDAISAALSKNNSLALNSQQHKVLTEQLKATDNLGSYTYQQLYISRNQNEQQREFLKDKITSDITKRYHNIILLEEELKTIASDIALQKENIKTLETQQKVGLVTPLQMDGANLELKKLESNKIAKEETLKSEKANFLILTNKDLDQYTLENNISFEAFRLDNPKAFFQAKADQYLKYQNELADLQSNNIFENFVNPLTGSGYAPTYAEYLSAKYSASSATLNVKDSRDNLVQSLLSSYASLLNLEEQINMLKSQTNLLEKQLATAQIQCKVGLMTKQDYNKQAHNLEDLEYNLLTLVNNYNVIVRALEKPWS